MFGISRQAFYQKQQREARRLSQLQQVKSLVADQRRVMPRLGTRKLHYLIGDELKELGIKIGRDRLFDFLRSEHLLVKPRKSYTKTTMSNHWLHKHPNLLKTISPARSEEVWVK
jgi:phage antirepressor YoqD-like protein